MDESLNRETIISVEMKPPFMMLKTSPGHLQNHSCGTVVPEKVSDDSQLNRLSSLFTSSQHGERFNAPKPPKKRYLEENYSQNKCISPVLENNGITVPVLNKSCEIPIAEVKKKKPDENSIFPDVNPILPDVVPKTENKDIEMRMERKSWRKKLLCWEKLDEMETQNYCDNRLKPSTETQPTEVNNNSKYEKIRGCSSRKSSTLLNGRCLSEDAKDTVCNPRQGRRGRARACKGQKYREFMWTNVMHQRRKSSRWELCQDTVETRDDVEDNGPTFHQFESDSIKLNKSELETSIKTCNSMDKVIVNGPVNQKSKINCHVNNIDKLYKKVKMPRKTQSNTPDNKTETNKTKSGTCESPKKKMLKKESAVQTNSNGSSTSSPKKTSPIIGSKKRKLRRQSIRRLEPGTSFKDTRVVEDSGLATLASVAAGKMKLRSDAAS